MMYQIVLLNLLLLIIIGAVNSNGLSAYYASNYPYSYASNSNLKQSQSGLIVNSNANDDTIESRDNRFHNNGKFLSNNEEYLDVLNRDNGRRGHDLEHKKIDVEQNNEHRVQGENLETDKSHNRKFVKSGFHHVYNKDESGSNSSYYEDSDDRGENTVYDKRHGAKGDVHDRRYQEGHKDDGYSRNDNNNYKKYKSIGDSNNGYLQAQNYGNRHNDKYNKDNAGARRYEYLDEQERYDPYYFDDTYYRTYKKPWDYNNGYTHRSTNDLPLQPVHQQQLKLPSSSLPLNRLQGDGNFLRHKITIYDDPRELAEHRWIGKRKDTYISNGNNNNGRSGNIYHAPRLDYRSTPDSDSLGFRDYYNYDYDSGRGSFRYY